MKFLTPIIAILFAFGIFFWYVKPTYDSIGQLQATAAQAQANLATAQAAVSKENDLVSRYNSFTGNELSQIATALPDTTDQLRVIIELNSIASKYGTTIHDIELLHPTGQNQDGSNSGQQYVTTPVTFTVSLTYPNFLSFLSDVEHDLRITDIQALSFVSKDGGIYDYTLTVDVYSLN